MPIASRAICVMEVGRYSVPARYGEQTLRRSATVTADGHPEVAIEFDRATAALGP